MPDDQEQSWPDNPNPPTTTYYNTYRWEKTWFTGTLIGSVFYGMVVVLFFKCITALFNNARRKGERIKWGLVSYTMIMFSLATVHIAATDHILSISYIDNRNFPGNKNGAPPGPYGYQATIHYATISYIYNATFNLSNWAADGLLLYRYYILYSKNPWAIAFPSLLYIASVVTGTLSISPGKVVDKRDALRLVFLSSTLSLNVLLTFMIIVRIVLLGRKARTSAESGISGLYTTIITMLIESSALFAVSSLFAIIPWALGTVPIVLVSLPLLAQIQVIASLLIIQRVANRSALTRKTVAPGSTSPFEARSRWGSSGGNGGHPVKFGGVDGTNPSEFVFRVGSVIDICRDKV